MHTSHLVVPYMLTGFAGCSASPGISCGARKLSRTLQLKKITYISKVKPHIIKNKCFKMSKNNSKNDMEKNSKKK